MIRNAKNTGATGGRSSGGTDVSGGKLPSHSCLRISPPSRGIDTS